jgi:hypothetical protein
VKNYRSGFVVLTLALLTAARLQAHHSFAAEFDPTRPVDLRGTVTEVEFINPHSWIHIAVTQADGSVESWAIEGGTPNTLFRQGITDESLPLGSEILVNGYRSRDGLNKASGRDITFVDGRKIFLSGSATTE